MTCSLAVVIRNVPEFKEEPSVDLVALRTAEVAPQRGLHLVTQETVPERHLTCHLHSLCVLTFMSGGIQLEKGSNQPLTSGDVIHGAAPALEGTQVDLFSLIRVVTNERTALDFLFEARDRASAITYHVLPSQAKGKNQCKNLSKVA